MSKVYINAIKFNRSLVDGPGVRTVVFFQGCDLHARAARIRPHGTLQKGRKCPRGNWQRFSGKNRSTER